MAITTLVSTARRGNAIRGGRHLFNEQDLADAMVGIEYRHGRAWIDEIP